MSKTRIDWGVEDRKGLKYTWSRTDNTHEWHGLEDLSWQDPAGSFTPVGSFTGVVVRAFVEPVHVKEIPPRAIRIKRENITPRYILGLGGDWQGDAVGRAQTALRAIYDSIVSLQREHHSPIRIPRLHAVQLDDGSISIEWVTKKYRIAFNIEIDPKDSSWLLITNGDLGNIEATGDLSSDNAQSIAAWLLQFVIMNP